jgi:hypothetical protein
MLAGWLDRRRDLPICRIATRKCRNALLRCCLARGQCNTTTRACRIAGPACCIAKLVCRIAMLACNIATQPCCIASQRCRIANGACNTTWQECRIATQTCRSAIPGSRIAFRACNPAIGAGWHRFAAVGRKSRRLRRVAFFEAAPISQLHAPIESRVLPHPYGGLPAANADSNFGQNVIPQALIFSA